MVEDKGRFRFKAIQSLSRTNISSQVHFVEVKHLSQPNKICKTQDKLSVELFRIIHKR